MADPDQERVVAVDGETLVGFAVLAGLSGSEGIELRRRGTRSSSPMALPPTS
ncbi:hypothetical protein [Streptomyces aurantiogriseus]|uniref:hypothetical protein n=1 Tax=Streptomyces aurantiogriseus TaxID=66870 RepID=UPI0016742C7E|nr:hypothetical protein [Streptomyces aurantiogriseus]